MIDPCTDFKSVCCGADTAVTYPYVAHIRHFATIVEFVVFKANRVIADGNVTIINQYIACAAHINAVGVCPVIIGVKYRPIYPNITTALKR
ncbi:hypothetical protein SDC9_209663 [bioreactor metagenome]|uniref:Uncharacterized protein n=1 Tax=bioreactor metagenome TaxID=1076179 RepID=A0A645JEX7_9ZZZZ